MAERDPFSLVAEFSAVSGARFGQIFGRLKLLAGLMGCRHDLGREGRFVLNLEKPVRMRLTVMPTLRGEAATVRLCPPDR